ncbi:RNA polymerase sigma factor [Paenibacillus radicis (ex Gao et al. 2016)]|uniref:RNA polymerase sigma factor n=1 Tax=Paenibacillus radicis (ex Gao et al. 2016) TaxID=1737354 RepID=A0A917M434_9BACL|nr:sigma-70 family RNA polymerase sigma factor [Paenibacillus radicis (ex Gao et al. 2016)]GGG77548.1 RNA polymerase sigma factor [Paenibacillus radicis (ex Gao et al. 2016)]
MAVTTMSELIGLALKGQKEAFEQLYNETVNEVYRTLYYLSGSHTDAEDIAQNVYLELYRNLDKYDHSRSLQGWLYGITIRQLHAHRRKKWKEYRNEQKQRKLQTAPLPANNHVSFAGDTQGDFVMEELHDLPEKLKEVLVLRYINDLPQQEIANVLSIPIGTVKSRLNQALVRMREKLGDKSI